MTDTNDVRDGQREPVINEREGRHAAHLRQSGAAIPEIWFAGNILVTAFFNASSAGIPDAERFVVSTVTTLVGQQEFPELAEATRTILHEESAHSRVHDAYNRYLMAQGLDIDRHIAQTQCLVAFLERHCSLMTRLALCAAIELFTASMAKQVLEYGLLEDARVDERMDRVWTWHALEELDHRSAVFDLYQAAGGSYPRRVYALLIGTALFLYMQHVAFFSLMRQYNALFDGQAWRTGLPFLFGRRGIYRTLFLSWLSYLNPRYHPSMVSISTPLRKQLHHYHIESELIAYFDSAEHAQSTG